MSSVSAKKKSIIDTPVANNTLLNQTASTSLYQQCSSLRANLMRIVGFSPFFTIASSPDTRQSTDPVTQLWDVFSLGVPLCFIYNSLAASYTKINIDTNPDTFDKTNERTQKHAVAMFSMQMTKEFSHCEPFTVTDLRHRSSTDGLVKVINSVISVVQQLPAEAFIQTIPSSPSIHSLESSETLVADSVALAPTPGQARNITREIVESERKFVQDLEIMQKYSNALSRSNTVGQDTIHLLFPNLNNLLNFQRKFLIKLEGTAEMPWPDQRWGAHFIECEEQFIVYEPYCANYTKAIELMLENEQHLMDLSHMISATAVPPARGELPSFLIKPIQRVCKYPLLLDSLIKACDPKEYHYYDELQAGALAAKRIAGKINEAQRRSENDVTVRSLHTRIEDWKGHHLSNFGELLLDDIFVVTKSEVDREYHVFLFEKIILCCKEAPLATPNGTRKMNKSNSILKKQSNVTTPTSLPGGVGQPHQKTTPLLLKGRIFLNNVTKSVPVQAVSSPGVPPQFPLAVWWRGDDDLEFFTLRCRTLDTMRQWEAQINRLIKEATSRRASERGTARVMSSYTNSTNPAPQSRQTTSYYDKPSPQAQSVYMASLPSHPANGREARMSPFSSDEQVGTASGLGYVQTGPQGYPPHDGFEEFEADDVYEDYPPAASYPSSGRGTPVGSIRSRNNAYSMPPERDAIPGYDRPRAQTEHTNGPVMAQWRSTHGIPPPPLSTNGLPTANGRPAPPRLISNASSAGYASDVSFGNGVNGARSRPPLRSQFSSTKLKSAYDSSGFRSQMPPPLISNNGNATIVNRSRSASQPTAYIPKPEPPPLPTSSHWSQRSNTSMGKRGSGSSQSSSDYSPTSVSPITPFGSSESSIGGRSQIFENSVKVKVHFHEDIFVIQVPRSTDYTDLVGKVGRKIRLCGPDRHDGPLRVKYCDEDGDLVSLGSTEDVQMAFEQFRPGGQVVLYVT